MIRTRLVPIVITICMVVGYLSGKELLAMWANEATQKAVQQATEEAVRDAVDKAAREAVRDAARKAAADERAGAKATQQLR